METEILIFLLRDYLKRNKEMDCWACHIDEPDGHLYCDGFSCKAHLMLWDLIPDTSVIN